MSQKKEWILGLMIAAILMPAAVSGAWEGPAGRWWRDPQIASQLQLSEGEVQTLERAFEATRLNLIRLKSQVEAEQFKLQTLVEKRDMDEQAIKAQHRRLEAARTALAEEQLSFFVQVRKIIGYERYRRLEAMQRR